MTEVESYTILSLCQCVSPIDNIVPLPRNIICMSIVMKITDFQENELFTELTPEAAQDISDQFGITIYN